MKKLIRLLVAIVVIVVLVRYCGDKFGNVISLPGGLGGATENTTEDSGGWFRPKNNTTKDNTIDDNNTPKDIKDLERQLGIGNDDSPSTTTTTIPSTTPSTSSPLTFKGIPITGSLTAFGDELTRAGFSKSGNGVYTGDFAGYSRCKVTPIGNNPVNGVRVDFPVITDWDNLEKSYDSLQASLTQKYGIEPVVSQGSNKAVYNLTNGTITLDADVKEQSSWHVILTYSNFASVKSSGTLGRNPIDDL